MRGGPPTAARGSDNDSDASTGPVVTRGCKKNGERLAVPVLYDSGMRIGLPCCLLMLFACGDGGSESGSVDAGGVVSADEIGVNVLATPEECDGPEVEPDFVFDLFDGAGEGNFYGTIVLPEEAEAGSRVQFLFDVNLGGFFGASAIQLPRMLTERTRRITYGVEKVPNETYYMALWVPRQGDPPVGSPIMEDDWHGFYPGVVERPAQYTGSQPIRIGTKTVCGMDFGIAPVPCAGSYGEACGDDEECRGTDCGSSIERHGACSGGVCIQLECQSDLSTPREATCIGGFNRD